MDIDAFSVAHRGQWERVDALVARRRLSAREADELVMLYRATARDLSRVRTGAPDPQLVAQMSQRVAAARGRITGTRDLRLADVRRFLVSTLPAALYRVRWWTVGVAGVELVIALAAGWWVLSSPEAMSALGSPRELDDFAHRAFTAYYSQEPAGDFAGMVWTNNARLAAVCVAGGITGLVPAWVLVSNAVAIGQAGAIMAAHGELGTFLALISPHGLLELTSLFIAGAAGLRLWWTALVPGPRARSVALAQEGRALIVVAVGVTITLAGAGLIEAFVTPAPVAWPVKTLIGALALALLCAYTAVLGRRGLACGDDADLPAWQAGLTQPVAG